jgi:hypothetical protein
MFKQMWKPGLVAGVIGGVVSILVSVLMILALFLPGNTGITLYCLGTPIGFLLSLLIGLLGAFLAQAQSPEKLTPSKGAVAGIIAGISSTLIGLVVTPILQQLPKWLGLQDKMIDVALAPSRMMGLSGEQLEMARAQIIASQQGNMNNTTMLVGMATGLVCGLALGIALGAGGGALGALIFKPSLRRKLVCSKCQATFELGGNAFIEAQQDRPDCVDYCNWDDLAGEVARQQRAVIADVIQTKGEGRQWQCGMCKTVQAY